MWWEACCSIQRDGLIAEYKEANICFCNCFLNTPKYGFCINLFWHGVFYSPDRVEIIGSS